MATSLRRCRSLSSGGCARWLPSEGCRSTISGSPPLAYNQLEPPPRFLHDYLGYQLLANEIDESIAAPVRR